MTARMLYFVATDRLASNENGNGEAAEAGADNLYEWHEEVATHTVITTFHHEVAGTKQQIAETNLTGVATPTEDRTQGLPGERRARV